MLLEYVASLLRNPRTLLRVIKIAYFGRRERTRFVRALNQGVKTVVLTYDFRNSSITYGDFLYYILLARFFHFSGLRTEIVLLKGAINEKWLHHIGTTQINFITEEYFKLINQLTDNSKSAISLCFAPEDFIQPGSKLDKYFLFGDHVLRGKRHQQYTQALLNTLISHTSPSQWDSFLFSGQDFSNVRSPSVNQTPTIALHIRWDKRYSTMRNIEEEDFVRIITHLNSNFKNHQIHIVTSAEAADHFRILASQHDLQCKFSPDAGDFMSDARRVLSSDQYIAYLGGGISTFRQYSTLPYVVCSVRGYELPNLWAASDQIFLGWRNKDSLNSFLRTLDTELRNS